MSDKELSPEVRVLLAFALSFLILILSRPLLVKPPPSQPETPATPAEPAVKTPAPDAEPAEVPVELPAGAKQGAAEELITVEGDLYQVIFSTRGAVVKNWILRRYQDEEKNPLNLVNGEAAAEYGDALSLWVAEEALRGTINNALFVPSATGRLKAPVTLSFEYAGGGVAVRKQFVFEPDSYTVEVATALSSQGKPLEHALAWRGAFGDAHDARLRGGQMDVFYRDAQQMVRLTPGDVKGEETAASGPFAFAGIEDRFFCAAFLPPAGLLRVTAFRHEIAVPGLRDKVPSVGVAVGGGEGNRLRLFVGPKDADMLQPVHPLLSELVDYGWFAFVAKPLFLAMRWIHDHIVPNYGWSIVLLTIVINFLLFPLKLKSLRSAMKMQKLAPQIKAIQEKYKHLKMKDPRRQEATKETMALYKKHGVNPLGGCLPMLFQLPFLYGFYKVLIVSIEMRHAPWFGWISDLSAPEHLPIKVLPLLMCGTQFQLQRMSPTPSPDPTQQKIMLFMPVMFVVFFWNLSSGLVLYWLTGNLVGIAQQWYINQTEMKHLVEEKKKTATQKKAAARK